MPYGIGQTKGMVDVNIICERRRAEVTKVSVTARATLNPKEARKMARDLYAWARVAERNVK